MYQLPASRVHIFLFVLIFFTFFFSFSTFGNSSLLRHLLKCAHHFSMILFGYYSGMQFTINITINGSFIWLCFVDCGSKFRAWARIAFRISSENENNEKKCLHITKENCFDAMVERAGYQMIFFLNQTRYFLFNFRLFYVFVKTVYVVSTKLTFFKAICGEFKENIA